MLAARLRVDDLALGMSRQQAWDLLMFYEEVDLEPPLFARIGLPHPLRTEGHIERVGDIKRCVYSSGYLRKRITRYEPGELVAFDVIEQVGVEDRSVVIAAEGVEQLCCPRLLPRVVCETSEQSRQSSGDTFADGLGIGAEDSGELAEGVPTQGSGNIFEH